ncbi:flippase-like domain-containing protein [Streptomyces sp. NBC_00151]|nr:flippase-like domain-containing protein [Streptomyces sp. NBC_00151]
MSAGLETLGPAAAPAAAAPDLDGPHLNIPAESGASRAPGPTGTGPGSVPAEGSGSPAAEETPRARRVSGRVRKHFGATAGVLILGVLLWRLGTGVFVDGLRRIDGTTLTVAMAIGLLTTVFSAWRWCLVARELRIELPLGAAVADYYRALFLNAALPGGVLGDVHRAVRHGQSAGDIGRGVRSVVLERTAGQAVLVAVGAVVLLTQPSPVLAQAREAALLLALVSVCGAVTFAVVRRRRTSSATGRYGAVRGALVEARGALLARRSWPGVTLASVLVLAGHLAMFVLAARAAGSDASVARLTPLALLALLAMGLPLNVGGWGPREGATAWAFGAAGLGAGMGLTVAVIYGVLSLAASLPGAVVLVVRWGAALRRPREESAGGPDQCSVSDVTKEKYAPKASASPARSSFPFSAPAIEGRPMTPDSV